MKQYIVSGRESIIFLQRNEMMIYREIPPFESLSDDTKRRLGKPVRCILCKGIATRLALYDDELCNDDLIGWRLDCAMPYCEKCFVREFGQGKKGGGK